MEIQITTRHDRTISQETKDFIMADVEGLEKFYDKVSSVHVILDKVEHKSGPEDIVEIIASVDGPNIAAKASDTEENMGKAFDEALNKIIRQLKKKNEMVKSHN